MKKIVKHGPEAREALLRGIDTLANAVKATLGPKGRLVVIGRRQFNQSPRATKDGVTVADHVNCSDPIEQMGMDLIREAAQKTVQKAGDGTTTATLLAQFLVHAGIQQMAAKHTPDELERGAKVALAQVLEALDKMALPAEGPMLEQVAFIAANGDQAISKLVVEAINRVGKDGVIACEASRSIDTTLEVTDGMQLPEGMRSPFFINAIDRVECSLDRPALFLHEGRIESAAGMHSVARLALRMDRPLLVVAGDYGPEALAFLVQNKVERGFNCCAIRASGWGDRRRDILRDLAVLAGGRAVTDDLGLKLENVTEEYFGKARRAVITEDRTVITGGEGGIDAVGARAGEIRYKIAELTAAAGDPDQLRLLEQRLSGLTGGVAVLKVGGATEAEMREKKDRVEDAMFATKAAAQSGVVPGGGLALLAAGLRIRGPHGVLNACAGGEMVRAACFEPMRQIAQNAGIAGDVVVEKVCDMQDVIDRPVKWHGYNAAIGLYENLLDAGILDPLKVVKEEITNAVSVAMIILRSEAVIAEEILEPVAR